MEEGMRTTGLKSAVVLLAAGLFCTVVAADAGVANPEQAFDEALALYRQGSWSSAYGRLSALADKGHAESARVALLMLRHGSKMHGNDWGASQAQINQWMALARRPMPPLVSVAGD
jgi:hypothetical protein